MLDRLDWSSLPTGESTRLAKRVVTQRQARLLDEAHIRGRIASLPFYEQLKLVWIELPPMGDSPRIDLLMLVGNDRVLVLDGTSAPIHQANESAPIVLTRENVSDYVRFFCFFVHAEGGPFLVVEALRPESQTGQSDPAKCREVERLIEPLRVEALEGDKGFRVTATLLYDRGLFRAVLEVQRQGTVVMVDDSPLMADVPMDLFPVVPSLFRPEPPPQPRPSDLPVQSKPRPPVTGGPIGGVILDCLIKLLLERALIRQASHRLIAHFNMIGQSKSPIEHFAEMLATASPVVVVESNIAFVEEVVARIAASVRHDHTNQKVILSGMETSDETRLRVSIPDEGPALVLIPMHAYRGIVDVQRVSHDLSTGDVAAIIGCERLHDLPESLREIVDVTIPLPAMSPAIFEALFQNVMGEALPTGWAEPSAYWAAYVTYTDLEHPFTLGLTPEEAINHIRGRVAERLSAVDAAGAPGLEDLYGLGEARVFASDLIADITGAMSSQVSWLEVDRGVLLVGPPGTGKTTLARAIAKDCGVKFINASAASWQAAGHLADHIRAIRADFSRARRLAPAILFIDEIDSIGSRDLLRGDNAQYQTEVVNAVLEQMQGLDPARPVIVIAATNYAERVDPALRRAGRLDRTIEIPYPSSPALAAIFDHYLKPFAEAGEVAGDLDTHLIGRLSLGLTGADVELVVRGARRRARRAGRLLNQDDLLSEVTGKPRDPSLAPRLTPEEVERVAVHEAGHALARCLSGTAGGDITFVSIVPRANGTLGFVAHTPSEKHALTRSEYIEHIETALAGRAAEEIRYGPDGVSSGADSDLKTATEIAKNMITRYGFGPNGSLVWSEAAISDYREQIDTLLKERYTSIRSKLSNDRKCLIAFAETLKERQELSGDEVVRLIGSGTH